MESVADRFVVAVADDLEILSCPCGSPDPPETWKELLRPDVRAKCAKCGRATAYYQDKPQALTAWNGGRFEAAVT